MHRAAHQPVAFHLPQRLRQHLLADIAHMFANLRKAQRAVLFQHFENEHRPFVGHLGNDVLNQHLYCRICIRGWRNLAPVLDGRVGCMPLHLTLSIW